jgi:hypothetical protein
MTRHSLAEILLMVLAVCGVLAILSLVGLWWVHLPTAGTPHGTFGFIFSVRRVTVISFSKVMVAVVVIAFAVVLSIRSRR